MVEVTCRKAGVQGILAICISKCEMSCWLHQVSGICFVPENCFNLRHHKIVTLSSGRRPALNTSCSLATRAAVSGDVNFPCYVVWRERRRLGLVFSLFSHGEAVADHVCRSTSGACARTSMFWSETSSTLSLSSAAFSRRPAASLGRRFAWRTAGAWPLARANSSCQAQ
jgi:hypothetical protein